MEEGGGGKRSVEEGGVVAIHYRKVWFLVRSGPIQGDDPSAFLFIQFSEGYCFGGCHESFTTKKKNKNLIFDAFL